MPRDAEPPTRHGRRNLSRLWRRGAGCKTRGPHVDVRPLLLVQAHRAAADSARVTSANGLPATGRTERGEEPMQVGPAGLGDLGEHEQARAGASRLPVTHVRGMRADCPGQRNRCKPSLLTPVADASAHVASKCGSVHPMQRERFSRESQSS